MAGLFAVSVDPGKISGERFATDLFWGAFYNQLLGEEFAGFAVRHYKSIWTDAKPGLIMPNFQGMLDNFKDGSDGIGYCGSSKEPLCIGNTRFGPLAVCSSGNIGNISEIKRQLLERGAVFGANGQKAEALVNLLVGKNVDMADGLRNLGGVINGACSLLALCREGIYVYQHPDVYFPLVLGEKEGAVAISCESISFSNLGYEFVGDVEPGEILLLENGRHRLIGKTQSIQRPRLCSLALAFGAYSASVISGIPVSLARKNMGAKLAKKDAASGLRPAIVSPLPNVGRHHALGYFREICSLSRSWTTRPEYDEPLAKFSPAHRMQGFEWRGIFMPEIQLKTVGASEDYSGQILVFCLDCLVTGRRLKQHLMPLLRKMGFREIHVRVSFPAIVRDCVWMDSVKKGEFLANMGKERAIADFLGADSLGYNTVEDFVEAVGIPQEDLCLHCVTR